MIGYQRALDIICLSAAAILVVMSVLSIMENVRHLYELCTGLVCAFFCLLPTIFARRHIMSLPLWFAFFMEVAIFFHAYGVLLMSYDLQKYYDTITHTFSSFVISLCVIMTLFTLQRYNERIKFTVGFTTVFIFLIMMAFGTYWEVLEYVVDQITGTGMQYSPFDTVRDMFSNALGSMLGSLFIYIYMRRWSIEEFIDSINVNKKLRKFLTGKHGEHKA
ncbi:MAG: hypothetical protein II805_03490 [Candidatus Methanomethylophilus sp.]|nr:hypothetical protein [Methanomethylophilus sp.]